MAGMLSPSAESQLNQMLSNLKAKNGDEIAVVTVPEIKPASSPTYFLFVFILAFALVAITIILCFALVAITICRSKPSWSYRNTSSSSDRS